MLISPLSMLLIVHPLAHIDIPVLIVILSLTVHQAIDPRTLLPRASGPFVLADASLQALIEISKVTLFVGSQPSAVAMEAAIDEPPLEKLSATLFFALKIVHDTHALRHVKLWVTKNILVMVNGLQLSQINVLRCFYQLDWPVWIVSRRQRHGVIKGLDQFLQDIKMRYKIIITAKSGLSSLTFALNASKSSALNVTNELV
jgi:hypothetical protein